MELNYFCANDPYDDEDVLRQVIANAPKEKSTRMVIHLFEYFVRLLKASLRE